jgi:hypothetical protein
MARADWDETAPMTKTLNDDSASLGNQFFHVEWQATPGRPGQEDISAYVYNDAGNVADVVRPVEGSVPGYGRAFFDVRVPRSPSYRVAVTSFDFIEPRGAK